MLIMLENCRLCQVERGTLNIACNEELINKIYECSGIKVSQVLKIKYLLTILL